MATPRLQDALQTIQAAVSSAINAIGFTNKGQTVIGWPTATDITRIMGQADGEYQVSIFPLPHSRNTSRYRPTLAIFNTPTVPTLSTAIAGNTITFSGTAPGAGVPNYYIHAIINDGTVDALTTVVTGQSLSTIATNCAAAITAAGITGVTASAVGAVVTIAGTISSLMVNISSMGGNVSREVMRIFRTIQVSIWTPSPFDRYTIADAIEATVGTTVTRFLQLSDGSGMLIRYRSTNMVEKSQSSYSMYECHIHFEVEYGLLQTLNGYVIAAVDDTQGVENSTGTQTTTQNLLFGGTSPT